MKKLMITGGLVGFVIGAILASAENASGSTVIWRAVIAACAAGWLMRWWGRVWVKGLHESYAVRASKRTEPSSKS